MWSETDYELITDKVNATQVMWELEKIDGVCIVRHLYDH